VLKVPRQLICGDKTNVGIINCLKFCEITKKNTTKVITTKNVLSFYSKENKDVCIITYQIMHNKAKKVKLFVVINIF